MRGPKPKAGMTNELNGYPGRRKPNVEDPRPEVQAPPRPKFLSKIARQYWDEITRELVTLKIIARIDVGVLAAHCTALATLHKAEKELQEEGMVVETQWGRKQSPWLKIAEKSREQVVRSSAELGLSASSRTRIKVSTDSQYDLFEEFQNRGLHSVK